MAGDPPHPLEPDLPLADVLVAVAVGAEAILRVVEVDEAEAVEASLGIQLTPPGPAVPLAEQARETDVARAAAAAAVMSPKTVEPPRPDASPASELRAAMERATPAIDQPRMVPAAESTAPAPPPKGGTLFGNPTKE